MSIVFVPFDGWTASPSYIGEGWSTVVNLYPAFGSWKPWPRFAPAAGEVADGPMVGAHVHIWASGAGSGAYFPDAQTIFAGSTQRLYSVDPATGAFTDISRAALYGPDYAGWRFASIGNDIWASNWIDPLQRRANNAGLFANGVTSTFTPCPRFIVPFREHLLGGNLSNAGRRQDEIVWSDADNAPNFDAPAGTSTSLAGSKPLVSLPGQITALVGGQYGLAFKESGMFYLEYTGTSQVVRPDVFSDTVGTRFPSSVIQTKSHGLFFLGADGFYNVVGLAPPVKVSPPGVDQYLIDSTFSTNAYGFFTFFEDTQCESFLAPGGLVGWAFRFGWTTHGNNVALLYNPVTQQWTTTDLADPDGENLAARPTVMVSRPYADTLMERTAALTWDGLVSKYAPLSSSLVRAARMGLRFRPLNFDESEFKQTVALGVLPIFSKSSASGAPLTPSVTVEPLLDPFGSPGTPETRVSTDRNPASGFYPFETASRHLRVSVTCAEEDFKSFEGVWLNTELLR